MKAAPKGAVSDVGVIARFGVVRPPKPGTTSTRPGGVLELGG